MKMRKGFWIILILLVLLAGCEIKNPTVPPWDVEFNVPLMNENYYGGDLINDDNFSEDSTQTLFFYTEGLIEGANIDEDKLKITENSEGSGLVTISQSESGDSLSINNPSAVEDVQIVSGELLSGELKFYFDGIHEELQRVIITFIELREPNGNPVVKVIDEPISGETYILPLENYRIYKDGEDNQILEELHFNLTQISSPSSEDSLGVMKLFYDNPLYFKSIRGLMSDLRISADDFNSEIQVEFPENIEHALELNRPEMKISIWNKIGFDADFYADYYAINNRTGATKTISVMSPIQACQTPGDSLLTTIELNDEVKELMSIAPDMFELRNTHFIINNPENRIGFASINIGYSGDYVATVPFDFTLKSGEPVRPASLTEININDDNRDLIRDSAKQILMKLRVMSEFNAGMTAKFFLCNSNDKNIVYQDTPIHSDNLDRLIFHANSISPGSPENPSQEDLSFLISEEDLAIFTKYPTIYFGMEFTFDDSNTIVHSFEKVKVISSLKLNIVIDPSN